MNEAGKQRLRAIMGSEPPRWVVICGSGLGAGLVADPDLGLAVSNSLELRDLGLPAPSVEGHGHRLVFGRVDGVPVCLQTGRLHPYEGHNVHTCVDALRTLVDLGARGVVLTCAVGALADHLSAGQLVVLRDQINLLGPTPLVGPQFIDCSRLYTPSWRKALRQVADQLGEELPEVVYIHARGPQYETPAETEALRRLGGDVVGMSTTYEALAAGARSIVLIGLGVVTNVAGAQGLSHEEVKTRSDGARGRLARILRMVLGSDPESPP